MSNHYQQTLDHIVHAQQSLLDDLIKEVDDLSNQVRELTDDTRKLEAQIEDARSDGYSDGYQVAMDEWRNGGD